MGEDAIVVRQANHADLGYVSQDGYIPQATVARKIDEQEVFILTVEGQPAGYLRLEFLWSLVPYIALIRIDEPYRGRGLSRHLLGLVEDHLRQKGYQKLFSSSQVNEPAPQAWHRHVGFMECGMINGINEGGIGELFFSKSL